MELNNEKYFNHPLIKPNVVEKRLYQEILITSALKKNTLIVLPTGLGKTIVALGVSVLKLEEKPKKNVLIMAPTKPLVEQHMNSFKDLTVLDENEFCLITGAKAKSKRKELWKTHRVFFATPQSVLNDLKEGIINPEDFSLAIFDEAHRAVGDYAYTEIAEILFRSNKDILFLALTASPGGTKEKIGGICGNLYIDNVEVKSDEDEDVAPYIYKTEVEWLEVNLNKNLEKSIRFIDQAIKKRLTVLKKMNIVYRDGITKTELLELQKKISERINQTKDPFYFNAISYLAQVLKLMHASELLQSQGPKQFYSFISKMNEDPNPSKAIKSIINDEDVLAAYNIANFMLEEGIVHPKMEKLLEVLRSLKEGQKAIVFTQYVETVNLISEYISANSKSLRPLKFTGQRKGMNQKQQIELLKKFKNEDYNILVATSVAEEGLDVPKVDMVVFYEPIPSEIRNIQRRGRTGRFKEGKAYILIAKKTIDESYYWASKNKERKMRKILNVMKKGYEEKGIIIDERKKNGQQPLNKFISEKKKPIIYVDSRENKLYDFLGDRNEIEVGVKQLAVGDYLVSERMAIERKTTKDFVQSIIDGRLFNQVHDLIKNFEIPVMIIEGNDIYGIRKVHPNAIRGAISSITTKYGIPIIWTKDENDSIEYIIRLALREHEEEKVENVIRGKKKLKTITDKQLFFLAGFPNINEKLARRLLEYFGSLKAIVNAKETELMKIEGIGKEKARQIIELLEAEYED